MNLRERMIDATIAHVEGKIAYHKANVEIYLTNPSGIGYLDLLSQTYLLTTIILFLCEELI